MSEPGLGAFHGNRHLVRRLERKVAEGRLPHGLLFAGPEGIGKRTFALRLAQALNCSRSEPQGAACGVCGSCRRIRSGIHPDVTMVTLLDDASLIKIEQVREVRSQLELGALEGRARVFLVDPAERMSPGAANALLKALEEPPDATHFILITTNPHAMLVTIRSRCQVYHFAPLGRDEVRASGVEDELVVRWSRGSVGRALSTDPDRLRALRDQLLDFVETAVTASEEELAVLPGASAELARSKDEYRETIRAIGVLVSDLLYVRQGAEERIVNIDQADRIRRIAAGVDLARIAQIGDCIRFIESALRNYVNRQMLSDALVLTLNRETAQILDDKPWRDG